VPGNRFTLAVRVGREIDGRGFLSGLHDLVDVLLVLVDELVLHREAVLGIDGAFLRHEIANVAVRRQHLEIASEVFLDRARLGRRFDNDEIFAHGGAVRRPTVDSSAEAWRSNGPHLNGGGAGAGFCGPAG
jgi:hypothetical protein